MTTTTKIDHRAAVVVAVDPGATSGLSCWAGGRLVYHAKVRTDGRSFLSLVPHLRAALAVSGLNLDEFGRVAKGSAHFVTEAQFVGGAALGRAKGVSEDDDDSKGRGFIAKAALVTGANATRWECAAELLRFEVLDRVVPASWRATTGIHHAKGAMKGQAITLARGIAGRAVDENEAEAIMIGLHAVVQLTGTAPPAASAALANRIPRGRRPVHPPAKGKQAKE